MDTVTEADMAIAMAVSWARGGTLGTWRTEQGGLNAQEELESEVGLAE